jgi:hypothetical protein
VTTLIHALRQGSPLPRLHLDPVRRRGTAVAVLLAAALALPGALEASLDALADAYLAVSVFVAGTLALLLAAERGLGTDMSTLLARHRRWQVPAGALLGAFPGCGGAIIAVTQFSRGHLSFGALVATLIATMGDAMFLLLARDPASAALVAVLSGVVAIVTGYALDALHGADFLRPRNLAVARTIDNNAEPDAEAGAAGCIERVWLALAVPGLVLGVAGAFQIDIDAVVPGRPAHWLGIAGALLALGMWVARGDESMTRRACDNAACAARASAPEGAARKLIDDTNFVTAWVVFAFVGFEILQIAAGVDLGAALADWGALVPLAAILVGFVPGCGPQIVITSLYLAGSVPLSAQLGNAISNDGDALFPAIAVAPKAALAATIYSAIPAFVVGYGWYWVVE